MNITCKVNKEKRKIDRNVKVIIKLFTRDGVNQTHQRNVITFLLRNYD